MRIQAIVIALLVTASPALAAQPQDAIKDVCSKGSVWRLPLPPQGFSTIEAPVKVDGKAGDGVRICNCAADTAGKNMGVWVRAYRSDEALEQARQSSKVSQTKKVDSGGAIPYYLPNLSCVLASSPTVVLAPVDKVETWGTWEVVK